MEDKPYSRRQFCPETVGPTNRQKLSDKQTDRQTDGKTLSYPHEQLEKYTYRHMETQKDRQISKTSNKMIYAFSDTK